MTSWTNYVTPYEEYVLLAIVFGLILLFLSFALMKRFRFQDKKPGRFLYHYFYGLSNRELVCLAAGTSRMLLVISLVLAQRSLRLSHMICLAVLSLLWQWDHRPVPERVKGFVMDLVHMTGVCVGLFVYRTLAEYLRDIRFSLDIQITGILLGLFVAIYVVTLWVNGLPRLGQAGTARKAALEKAKERKAAPEKAKVRKTAPEKAKARKAAPEKAKIGKASPRKVKVRKETADEKA